MIYPDPEIERDVYIPQSTPLSTEFHRDAGGIDAFDDQKQFFELFNSIQQHQDAGNVNANTFAAFAQFGSFDGQNPFFGNINEHENPNVPETKLRKLINSKIHIGIMAIFTYLFISKAPFHWNIFLIFLIWEIAEIFTLRQYESNTNGIVNVLFVLASMSPTKVNIVLKWVQLLNKVLRDVALFMFFFILAHVFRSYMTGFDLIPLMAKSHTISNIPIVPIDDINDTDDVFEHFEL